MSIYRLRLVNESLDRELKETSEITESLEKIKATLEKQVEASSAQVQVD